MDNTPTLFETKTIPLAEQLQMLEKQLRAGFQTYQLSFGIFKAYKGPEDHNALLVVKDNKGENYTISFSAETFHELITQSNEFLKTLNK